MPYKDPEQRRAYMREYQREYYQRNRERIRERARERDRKHSRKYYAQNRERVRDYQRQYYAQNREKLLASMAQWRAANPGYTQRRSHGADVEAIFAAMWRAQGGCCYLCGRALQARETVIDHDHGHCPPHKSCPCCRRGLAHSACNTLIGLADEDPDRLRHIADALEAAQAAAEIRKASMSQQLTLDDTG